MKFEKDLFAIIFNIVLIFVLSIFLSLLYIVFFIENKGEPVNWNFIIIASILITILILLFIKQSVQILEDKLIIKNIFGLTLKTLNLKSPYVRKIKKSNTEYHNSLWSLFGKKYATFTEIHFEVVNEKSRFHISGHFLTEKGLKQLIKMTKKKNIC